MSAIILLITLFVVFWAFLHYNYRYWKDRGIQTIKGRSVWEILFQESTVHGAEVAEKNYKAFKGKAKLVGDYKFFTPILYILDLDLVKSIFIKDFNLFADRFIKEDNNENDPISLHLFRQVGQDWRVMRTKLTPTFTSGKLKTMFPIIIDIAERFNKVFEGELEASKDKVLEVYDLSARFTTDIIGSVIFGVESNSLNEANSQFRRIGRLFFDYKPFSVRLHAFTLFYLKYFKFLNKKTSPQEVLDFVMGLVKQTVTTREKNNIQRNDFMNLLIEMRNQKDANGNPGLTMEEIASQSFVFFAAGFETSSSLMSFALYFLAVNPDMQEKLRDEINEVLEKTDGKLVYDSIKDMKYLGQVVQETLRMRPAVVNLQRVALQDYKVPGTDYVIPKHTTVFIPVKEIHFDPEIYPEPEKFRPERFEDNEVKKRHPLAFLTFGDGPRNCIGLRFGGMQARIGLVTLLRTYRFSVCDKTSHSQAQSDISPVWKPLNGVYLKVEKI